jgi:DNA mismatch repair protein MutS2
MFYVSCLDKKNMNLEPKDLFAKLEFDKVITRLQAACMGELGAQYFEHIEIQTDVAVIEAQLKAARELKLALEKNDRPNFGDYQDTAADLKLLAIEGYVLSVESLQRINVILLLTRDLVKFFTPLRRELYPTVYQLVRSVESQEFVTLANEILRVIDDAGNIKADASPELVQIRKQIQGKQRELDRVYRIIIAECRSKGFLTDNAESFRNGRRVLSVPSEHKRKIRGIMHDESATGKTTFIEPEAAVEVNNDIFDLEQDERAEIYRILRTLSQTLRPYCDLLATYQSIVVQFDILLSKARLGLQMKGNMPQIRTQPTLQIRNGKHPLLYLKNRETGRETVPFNLQMSDDDRIMVLSGPNAGGKSIAMKSVGLLQLMFQAGLLVPVHELSVMGIFTQIFAHIGDAQSLEDDLSTYSSHLQNMNTFLGKANKSTLFLIDEFGSGTDPKMGGAIAEGILKELNQRQAWGVVTTHYGNLKMFAYRTQGIINACMNFDKDNLAPTYQLTVGRPGSSYAFEIATKVGLNPKALQYARQRVGENEQAVDELLIDLQREKQELSEKLVEINEKQKLLDRLVKTYDEQVKDVEFRRKKLKLDSKEQLLQFTAKENKEIEQLLKQLREEKNLDRAKEIAEQLKQERTRLVGEVTDLTEEIYYQPSAADKKEIAVGDFVKMKTGGATGKVETLDNKEAVVVMGEMRMKIKLRDLQLAAEPLEIRDRKGINTDNVTRSAQFDSKIDIRGLDVQSAMQVLESFFDQALITSANHLRIVHGKGNGVLRKIVKQKLREYRNIGRIYHPENHEGGDGVTIVEMA